MAKKRKLIPRTDPQQYPCPLCGSDDYEYGTIDKRLSTYSSEDTQIYKALMQIGTHNIKCRACLNCGHLLFLVDER